MKNFKKLIKESYLGNPLNEVVRGDDFRFIEIKDLHFETDPDRLEDMKISFGEKMGGFTTKDKIEDAEYELRRFRKSINYGDGTSTDPFLPGTYDAATSKLGDGPHAKKVPTPKWNERKYEQWIEDVASGDGAEFAYDMAQNAKMEAGLIDWVKKNRLGFGDVTPLERIQYDIEALAESVEGDKIVREISTTPVSGTKAGVIYSLDNRKYVLTNDVKGARIGDYTNITLPKGTVIYNLPGGLMADHESLRQYAKLSGNIYFDKPTYAGVGIRRMPDILTAIENNSNVIEESLNENMGEWPKELTSRYSDEYRFELEKVSPTYQDKPGRAKYRLIDIESGELKGTPVFGTPESLMDFADDLIKPQGGTQSSHFGTNEGTCGYGEDGKIGDKPAGPDLNEMEDEMLFMDRMYKDAAETSINLDDFKRTIKATYGKYAEDDDTLEAAYERFRITRPDLEEDEDLDINYSDASAGDKSIEDESASGAYESKTFDFKKMVKEALTPNNLR